LAEQAYAYVTLIPVAKGFQQKIATEMAGVGGAGGVAGKKFSQGFAGSLKGLIGPALATAGVAAFAGFAKSAVSEASNLEESLNAVNVAFGASADGILKFGETSATALGVSQVEFNNAAVRFSAFAERIVGAGNDASGFIADVSTRATDFASVFNIDVKEALGVFQSGLAGEAEPLKRFGINLLDSEVKAFAMANGIGAVGRELTETEKVQARYGLLMEATAKTQGDFANTSDGLANGMRILKATIADTQAEVGAALLPALQALVPAITPIVQTLAPLLARVFESLAPLIVQVAESLGPLIEAMMPLFETFELIVAVAGELLAAILPPFIELVGALAPIVLALAEAFMPIIQAILPPLIRLIESLIPFIEMFASILADFWIPLLAKLIEAILPVVVYFIDLFARALEDLNTILAPVFAALKPVADALLAIAGIKPGDLKKNIVVTTSMPDDGGPMGADARERWLARQGTGSVLPVIPIPEPDLMGGAGAGAAVDNTKKVIKEARKAIKDAQKEYRKAVREANQEFTEQRAEILENFSIAIAKATIQRDTALADALKQNTQRIAEIQADFANRLDDIVKTSMNRLRDAYRSAVEINVASIFDSDVVAGSIDGTIEMMRQKLIASRQLLANAASLAAAGFSQTFIEQVVGAGTDVGNELAQSILNATPEQQAEMRNLFNSIETEASAGMDALTQTIYDKNGLATQELRDLYAQTQAELVTTLAEQEMLYQEQMTQIMATFDQAILDAKTARDAALLEAEEALQEALLLANENFLKQIKTIRKEFKSQIDAMSAMVSSMISRLNALASAAQSATAAASAAASASTGRVAMAKGGLVTGPTNALIGEAGPELVIPLDKFESWMNMGAGNGGKALNYYAAPNQSLDSETELFNAMKRAKVVVGW
jgi:phage-related protein